MARRKKKTAKKTAAKGTARKSGGNLVRMTRGGETIKVNPKCVKDHERLGWSHD
jgi:hypothetical protein